MKPLISVIVPVYKVEEYLEKCVNSIRNQTYKNLEIILVDDGSPDNCGIMCDEFARQDSRIKVIHKENGGLSSARNKGLDIMSGDLVGFVDSDDWIDEHMYETLYKLKVKTRANIIACGMKLEHPNGKASLWNEEYLTNKECSVYTTEEALRVIIDNKRLTYSVADKLFDRDVFLDIRMTEGALFEDEEILPKCIELAQIIAYNPEPLYHYRQTQDGITHMRYTVRHFREADIAWEKTLDYKERYPELYMLAYAGYVATCIKIIHLSKKSKSCKQERKKLIKRMQGDIPKEAIACLTKNTRIKLAVLRIGIVPFDCLMTINNVTKKIFRRY